jgi:hypothetical protein
LYEFRLDLIGLGVGVLRWAVSVCVLLMVCQLKSIRQDLMVQHLETPFTVHVGLICPSLMLVLVQNDSGMRERFST